MRPVGPSLKDKTKGLHLAIHKGIFIQNLISCPKREIATGCLASSGEIAKLQPTYFERLCRYGSISKDSDLFFYRVKKVLVCSLPECYSFDSVKEILSEHLSQS